MRSIPAGARIGPYAVEAELARGGMGVVYRARRLADGAPVALKVLAAAGVTPERLVRFEREALLAARLQHPAIVRVHDAGVVPGGLPFIVMDLVDGAPLSELAGRVTPLEAARLVAQVARAVEFAHAHGVVHRDLKPDNVLVRRDDGSVVVTDFGIARGDDSERLTRTGALVGTPAYLAPEQVTGGAATAKSDVHALGAVLYEVITGRQAFPQQDLVALIGALGDHLPAPPGTLAPHVPRALDRLVLAALAKAPAARPDAGELAARLEAIAAGEGEPPPRRPLLVVALVVAAVTVGAVTLALFRREATPEVAPAPTPTTPAPTTTPSAEPPPPTAEEPPWLRALVAARVGDDEVLAALNALRADPDLAARLEPGARGRALAALAALDAVDEPASGLVAPDAAARAVFSQVRRHALWRRLDPDHRITSELSAAITAGLAMAMPVMDDRGLRELVGELVALSPDDVNAYLAYKRAWRSDPGLDPDLVRVGIAVARAQGNYVAWGTLTEELGVWLCEVRGDYGAALDLARAALEDAELAPERVAYLLVVVARGGRLAEARWLVERALELRPDHPMALVERAEVWLRASPPEPEAAERDAARALSILLGDRSSSPAPLVEAARIVAEVRAARGELDRALATLDEVRAANRGTLPGVALLRALLLARSGAPEITLREALADLVRSVADLVQALRARDDLERVARAEPILAEVRRVAGLPTREEVARALARLHDDETTRTYLAP